MVIRLTCSQCGKELAVRDELAGRKGRCPGCGAVLTVPDAAGGEPTLTPQPMVKSSGTSWTWPAIGALAITVIVAFFIVVVVKGRRPASGRQPAATAEARAGEPEGSAESSAPQAPPSEGISEPRAVIAGGEGVPDRLAFPAAPPALAPGMRWHYQLSWPSSMSGSDTLTIAFAGENAQGLTFDLQAGGVTSRVEVPVADATWLFPSFNRDRFELLGVGDLLPRDVEQGVRVTANDIRYSYDRFNRRTASGHRMVLEGPVRATVPSGEFISAKITKLPPEDYHPIWEIYIAPDERLAVLARHPRGDAGEAVMFGLTQLPPRGLVGQRQ